MPLTAALPPLQQLRDDVNLVRQYSELRFGLLDV
jgi:hypothetical protein